jgi:FkbM family methyltransferase
VWQRLGQAKQEFIWSKTEVFMDSDIYKFINSMLPDGGFYVDVGAHDGRSMSNTYHLERSKGWNGILIEPILSIYLRLRELRSLDTNIFVNCACVSFEFDDVNLEMQYGDSMSFAPEISSVEKSEWSKGAKKFLRVNEQSLVTWVPARTLQSILDEASAPQVIDFLSIDVEGAELEVLRGVNFGSYRFRIICVESFHPDLVTELLLNNGYQFIENIKDNLVFRAAI